MSETWHSVEELVDDGLVKNIGLSNVQGSLLFDVLRYARIPPQVLQVEIHPYLSQEPLVKLAHLYGIAVTAYSSFGPAVSRRASPGSQHILIYGWIELHRTFDGSRYGQPFRAWCDH